MISDIEYMSNSSLFIVGSLKTLDNRLVGSRYTENMCIDDYFKFNPPMIIQTVDQQLEGITNRIGLMSSLKQEVDSCASLASSL